MTDELHSTNEQPAADLPLDPLAGHGEAAAEPRPVEAAPTQRAAPPPIEPSPPAEAFVPEAVAPPTEQPPPVEAAVTEPPPVEAACAGGTATGRRGFAGRACGHCGPAAG